MNNMNDKKEKFFWNVKRCLNIMRESLPAFTASEGQLRASSLTYYTLFAIVPVFALIFGVAKGFSLDEWLKQEMSTRMSEHGEILNWLYNFADKTLSETRGGLVAGVGALILCWSVVKMIGNIEGAINRVWKVQKNRTIFRKFTDYLSFLVIVPTLLLAASSASVLVSRYVEKFSEGSSLGVYLQAVTTFGLKCMPYFLVWVLFSFIYIFLPNTRVKFSAAIFGGVIAGSIYQILQSGYFFVQMGLSRYNVIYGSFSALPLFLIWVYLNWLILLFGVTLSYLYQKYDYVSKQARDHERTQGEKRLMALMLAAEIAHDFACGNPPPTEAALAEKLGLSPTMTAELMNNLRRSNVIAAIDSEEYDAPGYHPAIPLQQMTIAAVMERYDDLKIDRNFAAAETRTGKKIFDILENMRKTAIASQGEVLLCDLINK